jgi:hypothetical protein
MQIDLPQLVREALDSLGCDPSMISDLDGHSAIALDFEQMPSLLISEQDQQVWLWSRVTEYSESIVAHKAVAILGELMRSDDSILGGQPGLTVGEGWLELRVVLAPAYLESGARLGEALSLFFERIDNMVQLIRQ